MDDLNSLASAVSLLRQLSDLGKSKKLLADLDDRLSQLAEFQKTKQEAEHLHMEATALALQAHQAGEDLKRKQEAHDQAAAVWVQSSQEQQNALEAKRAQLLELMKENTNRSIELQARESQLKVQEEETKQRRAQLEQDEADYDARMAQLPRKRA